MKSKPKIISAESISLVEKAEARPVGEIAQSQRPCEICFGRIPLAGAWRGTTRQSCLRKFESRGRPNFDFPARDPRGKCGEAAASSLLQRSRRDNRLGCGFPGHTSSSSESSSSGHATMSHTQKCDTNGGCRAQALSIRSLPAPENAAALEQL